jgi:hypothetical protein
MLRLIADRAERKLRAFVTSKGHSFTPASVPAGWHALLDKRCVMGHFETGGGGLTPGHMARVGRGGTRGRDMITEHQTVR